MEIAEKENVLLTICLIDERERESLAWLPSVGGGGGGKGFAGFKGRRDVLHFRQKIVPPQLKLGF